MDVRRRRESRTQRVLLAESSARHKGSSSPLEPEINNSWAHYCPFMNRNVADPLSGTRGLLRCIAQETDFMSDRFERFPVKPGMTEAALLHMPHVICIFAYARSPHPFPAAQVHVAHSFQEHDARKGREGRAVAEGISVSAQ